MQLIQVYRQSVHLYNMSKQAASTLQFVVHCQALVNGFLDFSNFDVLEYEHYEVAFVFNDAANHDDFYLLVKILNTNFSLAVSAVSASCEMVGNQASL